MVLEVDTTRAVAHQVHHMAVARLADTERLLTMVPHMAFRHPSLHQVAVHHLHHHHHTVLHHQACFLMDLHKGHLQVLLVHPVGLQMCLGELVVGNKVASDVGWHHLHGHQTMGFLFENTCGCWMVGKD